MTNCIDEAFGEALEDIQEIRQIKKCILGGQTPCQVFGVSGAQKAHVAAQLTAGRPLLYVTHSPLAAVTAAQDLEALLGERVAHLPAPEFLFGPVSAASREVAHARLTAFSRVLGGEARVVVASVEALLARLIPPHVFAAAMRTLAVGERLDAETAIRRWVMSGYERVERVEGRGQLALRGGILDIFPPSAELPYRVELFDDEIDSLRTFDVETQRSVEKVESVRVEAACEFFVEEHRAASGIQAMRLALKKAEKHLASSRKGQDEALRQVLDAIDAWENSGRENAKAPRRGAGMTDASAQVHALVARYEEGLGDGGALMQPACLPFFYEEEITLLDYLPEDALLVCDEPVRMAERAHNELLEFGETLQAAVERGDALHAMSEWLLPYDALLKRFSQGRTLLLQAMPRSVEGLLPKVSVSIAARQMQPFHGQMDRLCAQLQEWMRQRYRVAIVTNGKASAERIAQELTERHVPLARLASGERLMAGACMVDALVLSQGFEYVQEKLAVVTAQELFAAARTQKRAPSLRRRDAQRIDTFTDLHVGDYVVHEVHGIALFSGMVRLTVEGRQRDYLHLHFAGGDKLYVPSDQIARVQKYIGAKDAPPKLNRMGGKEWERAKRKAKESVAQMAQELVALYAARRQTKGYAFAPDKPWQKQFEENFPYEETPDQLISVEEVKRDMESPVVMDRLLCGDVGYGKTEVALRAAFKAVTDGKQVAVLAPTTILAAQHARTFAARMADFPVRVELLSRFRTGAEVKSVLQKLRTGLVDIVVGTHALLGKDVQFKDLGLLIVDEEQRFGVAHKERIKRMKHNVDVLTLTATPIPRTLHMSLTGIRDMSVIETPPEERYPVQTYVLEYQEGMIRDAILREKARGGQVYFLYNRVVSIDRFAEYVRRLVPEASVGVAHGQMKENALEDIMGEFIERAFDVLLCTTIVENGLDIPNVNTLIVYDADRFGLSQLYQLRGRVGRSSRLAYAYFTFRRDKVLGETAEKRLQAIRDFTSFGSGFKIAMRDLEIRGAGNLLGAEQHGHMAAVGYEMYCKLMEAAVHEERGEVVKEDVETSIDVSTDAYLPESYIASEWQRIEMYKRIGAIDGADDAQACLEELIDRYGDPPKCVENLVTIAKLKAGAAALGIVSVTQKAREWVLQFAPAAKLDPLALIKGLQEYGPRAVLSAGEPPRILLRTVQWSEEEALRQAAWLVQKCLDCIREGVYV